VKSENKEGASACTNLNMAPATSRISTSPGIEPRTVRKCRSAPAFAVTTIFVSVALGKRLRTAVRIALFRSFFRSSTPVPFGTAPTDQRFLVLRSGNAHVDLFCKKQVAEYWPILVALFCSRKATDGVCLRHNARLDVSSVPSPVSPNDLSPRMRSNT
jgi:hypothetical protein